MYGLLKLFFIWADEADSKLVVTDVMGKTVLRHPDLC